MTVPASLVITTGEPAGIGPELCARIASQALPARIAFVGDSELLVSRASAIGAEVTLRPLDPNDAIPKHEAGRLCIIPVPLAKSSQAGQLDAANAPYVVELLNHAVDYCRNGTAQAMVTAPVQKSTLAEAGIRFSGHTEYLAKRLGAPLPVMLLAGARLRVALVTTHLRLAEVPAAITAQRLTNTLQVLHGDLRKRFGIVQPRILVLGLNPHAGEAGHLGREEIEVIQPVVSSLRQQGMDLIGPVPADTAFVTAADRGIDAVLAMYHDQGLPVIKTLDFGEVVNVTLGLPIIRTSVDHGTALDIAGTGKASATSLLAAIDLAINLIRSSV
ncbi:MAG: 4-hydroxythreonine-4-phosphate dehydrogenase PdxA [Gammaproteobacteria bacterium]